MGASNTTEKEQTQDNSLGALAWQQAKVPAEAENPAMLPYELVIYPAPAPVATNKKD